MSDVDFRDLPPNDAPVTELHVWIGVHADGREAMLSSDMPSPLPGVMPRHMPLMSSRRDLAEALEPMARRIQREGMHKADRLIRLELRTFKADRDDIYVNPRSRR